MKKILCIAPYQYLPHFSGGQKLISQFYNYLSDAYELHVLSTDDNSQELVNKYKLYPYLISNKLKYADARLFWKIKELVQQVKPDYLLLEHPYMAWLGWLLKKSCNIPLIYHTHNIEYQRFRSLKKAWWPGLKIYESWAYKNADYLFCITDQDKRSMVTEFGLDPEHCLVVPYGITTSNIPADKRSARQTVLANHQLPADTTLLFFNGLLNYQPNLDALDFIIHQLNPELKKHLNNYRIIIAGNKLPPSYNQLRQYADEGILFTGFLENIDTYTKAADVLLNPVVTGGGVKTKVIDALALNTHVVSTKSGAIGINPEICGSKMQVVPDYDSRQFAAAVSGALKMSVDTPESFYDYYYWEHIIQRVKNFLEQHKS